MTAVDLTPGSPAWLRVVTASKVAAIVGVSPYESPLSMWRKMRGLDAPDPDNPAMERGRLLEPAVLAWWHARHPDARLVAEQPTWTLDGITWGAATPDEVVILDGDLVAVEAKTTSSWEAWGEPGTDEVPAWYAAQACWQLAMCPDARRVHVPVLGPRLDFREYVVERDDDLIGHLFAVVEDFADSLTQDVPPHISDHPADYAALCRSRTPDGLDGDVEIDRALAAAWRAVLAAEDDAPVVRARLLDAMGTARRALDPDGVVIARQQRRGDAVTLVRAIKRGHAHLTLQEKA